MFAQVTPPHVWTEDKECHYLRLTLAGFKDENIVINMDKYGHLVVRGDKEIGKNEYITFEETFEVPRDADISEASGLFADDQTYIIDIPKKRPAGQAITRAPSIKDGKKLARDNNPRGLDNNPSSLSRKQSTIKPIHKHPSSHKQNGYSPKKEKGATGSPSPMATSDEPEKKNITFCIRSMTFAVLLIFVAILATKFGPRR